MALVPRRRPGQSQPPEKGAGAARPEAPGLLSRRLVLWLWPVVRRGERRSLELEDLPELMPCLQASPLSDVALERWREEVRVRGAQASLGRVVLRMHWGRVLVAGLVSVLHGVLAAGVRPLLLQRVIRTVADLGVVDVVFLGLVLLVEAFCQLWTKQMLAEELGLRLMSTCTVLISERMTRVAEDPVPERGGEVSGKADPPSARAPAAAPPVAETQLIGNDLVRSLENFMKLFHFMSSVVQIACAIVVLLLLVGSPALAGITLAFLVVVFSNRMAKINRRNDQAGLEAADRRIALLRQILDGVRFIKLSAWEESYLEVQTAQRSEESKHNRRYRTLEMANASLGRTTPPLSAMATFVTMALLGRPMEPAAVFSALSLFMTLRLPLGIVPESFVIMQSLRLSLQRIQRSLQRPDAPRVEPPDDPGLAACLSGAELAWGPGAPAVLRGVSASVAWGEAVAVVGAVASGKSTLLMGLLGGLGPSRGSAARCRQAVAYVPQRPVVFSGDVLSNVLMGQPLHEQRLTEALAAAQFLQDLKLMPHGLATEIGERGTTLSGGQQTRLNVARALYHDPRLLVADDPLAAVDVHVASALFRALQRWTGRARGAGALGPESASAPRALVMVTNQLHLLPEFDKVLYLEGGTVAVQGSPSDLEAGAGKHPELKLLLESGRLAVSCADVTVTLDEDAGPRAPGDALEAPRSPDIARGVGAALKPLLRVLGLEPCLAAGAAGRHTRPGPASRPLAGAQGGLHRLPETSGKPAPAEKLVKVEHRARGSIASGVAAQYFRAVGWPWACACFCSIILAYGLLAANDVWLAQWVREAEESGSAELVGATVYGGLALAHAVMMILCNVASGFAGAQAARQLHRKCLAHTLHAPVQWFEETPSGRTLSRFSSDMSNVDLRLPSMIDHSIQMMAITLVLLGMVCAVLPWMCVFIVVVGPLYARLDLLVNRSSREAKRITNNALSPVLTLVQEATGSRVLLRVMGKEAWLHRQLLEHLDVYAGSYYVNQSLMTFLRFQGNVLGVCLVIIFTLLLWAFPAFARAVPGGGAMVGLALTYSFIVPHMLSYLSLFSSFTRVFLASLERLLEQQSPEHVPQEGARWTSGDPPAGWPREGRLELREASLRYRPHLPPAIDGLTLRVAAGERLGVVGRTGAGKSSISVMLLRLVEPAGGLIAIDGVDITKVGLRALRRAVAVVPQDPFLFQGSLRRNLDPLGAHEEGELLRALERVGLALSLESEVGNGGSQLSAGQRQLAAIARATLSLARIVVMDEPTASCDSQTDALLQRVMQQAFVGRTVLCIAHRLNTILGFDSVLVMEAGRAIEHGCPAELAGDASSSFAQMLARARVPG